MINELLVLVVFAVVVWWMMGRVSLAAYHHWQNEQRLRKMEQVILRGPFGDV